MKISQISAFSFLVFFGLLVLVPHASAASDAVGFPYWAQNGILSCNPLSLPQGQSCSLCDLMATAQRFIYFMMTLAVMVIAPIWIVIGGFMVLISAGSSERVTSGRKMITGAVIGILISLGAFVIINTFFYFIAQGSKDVDPSKYWPTIQCTPGGSNNQPVPGTIF